MFDLKASKIGIVGLGYVGLPLAIEFGKKYPTIGLDVKEKRVAELRAGQDSTCEVEPGELSQARQLTYTTRAEDLSGCNVYIVTVPTPVDRYKRPDLSLMENASRTVGQLLGQGDVVIYESTVFPGASEEVCVPLLEDNSGLKFNRDFFAGYSPERINPGDHEHRLLAFSRSRPVPHLRRLPSWMPYMPVSLPRVPTSPAAYGSPRPPR